MNNDPIIWAMLNAIKEQQSQALKKDAIIRQLQAQIKADRLAAKIQQAQIVQLMSQVKAIQASLKNQWTNRLRDSHRESPGADDAAVNTRGGRQQCLLRLSRRNMAPLSVGDKAQLNAQNPQSDTSVCPTNGALLTPVSKAEFKVLQI